MSEVHEITKLPKKNMFRIKKKSKHDFQESYTLIHQQPGTIEVSNPGNQKIDNIYLLKYFTVDVEIRSPRHSLTKPMTIQHCKEVDLGKQLGLDEVKDVAYSEDGKLFLDPKYKGEYVYANLRAGDFNRIHVLSAK